MKRDVKGYVQMVKKEKERLGINNKPQKPVKKEDMNIKKQPAEQEREI